MIYINVIFIERSDEVYLIH